MRPWGYSAKLGFGSVAIFVVIAILASFTVGAAPDDRAEFILYMLLFWLLSGLVLTLIIAFVRTLLHFVQDTISVRPIHTAIQNTNLVGSLLMVVFGVMGIFVGIQTFSEGGLRQVFGGVIFLLIAYILWKRGE